MVGTRAIGPCAPWNDFVCGRLIKRSCETVVVELGACSDRRFLHVKRAVAVGIVISGAGTQMLGSA